ncbi:HIT domain-containing protein [candidate division KSB1 bacterium]|nr:HIT domain-containing protein [candidate division KSB1 bacterium]
MDCLFCKIAAKEIPAKIVHEDEELVAFEDISPQAPVHILVIPRQHISRLNDLQPEHDELVGKIIRLAKKLAKERDIDQAGYRVVMNCNEQAGQSVFHIHLHLLGGRAMQWPPG